MQVQVDAVQFQQVIMNLIRNAIEAMNSVEPNARRLRVATKIADDSTALLSIQDSGPGVPAGDHARIFDAFFTTKVSGTGLGLAICRTIVEAHGGQLRLTASGPEGAVFEVALPRHR
jgi:signal transduction histidine kinase